MKKILIINSNYYKKKISILGVNSNNLIQKIIKISFNTIDKYYLENNFKKIDILKIDTEGNELNVLKGSSNILKKINFLVVELRLKNIKTYNPNELIAKKKKKNFIWDSIIETGYARNGLSYIDILFKKIDKKNIYQNYRMSNEWIR